MRLGPSFRPFEPFEGPVNGVVNSGGYPRPAAGRAVDIATIFSSRHDHAR